MTRARHTPSVFRSNVCAKAVVERGEGRARVHCSNTTDMTAITVTDEVQKAFGAMKDDKKHKVRVLVLSIDPSEKVVVDTQWEDEGKVSERRASGQCG